MTKYIVVIKNGTIRSATSEQEQELFLKLNNENNINEIIKVFGVDTYVARQTKESTSFLNFTQNIMDAAEFATAQEAKAFVDYLDEVKKTLPTHPLAEIKAAKITIITKEYVKYGAN